MATKHKDDVTVSVQVTSDDIVHGVRADCWHCPIARALSRAVGQEVHVNYGRISDGSGNGVVGGGRAWERSLPRNAINFQLGFDCREPVEPFAFEVSVPKWYVRKPTAV